MKKTGSILTIAFVVIFLLGTFNPVFGGASNKDEDIYLNFNFSKPVFDKTSIKGESFDLVRIDEMPITNDLGIPRLPVKSVRILLPQGKDVEKFNVIGSGEMVLGSDFVIAPGSRVVPLIAANQLKNAEKSNIVIKKYSTPLFENKGIYKCRGFNILHVNLYPVQYNTETGELSYFEDMEIVVETKSSSSSGVFRGLDEDIYAVQNIVDNPDAIKTYLKTNNEKGSPQEQYDYVVITNEDLKFSNREYNFQDLLDYKESFGLTTKIVVVEDILNNPDYNAFGPWGDANSDNPFYESEITGNLEYFDNESAKIRNFIRFAYTEWGTKYILLGGDADVIVEEDNIIPLRGLFANESGLPLNGILAEEEDDIPSDIYYSNLDGNFNYDCDNHFGECSDRNDAGEIDEADLYSEVYIGRACVDSTEELSNFVKKTLQYSQGNGDYYSKILFIGEDLGSLFYTPWGGDYKDVFEDYIPSQYELEKLYDRDDPQNNWDPYDLITRLKDDPVQFINHDGHGNSNYILKMHSSSIETLENDKHFFIYSHSCYTGSFDNKNCWSGYSTEDCIAEILTAEIEYGAYACILNARFGLGSEDTIDSPSGALDGSFIKALFVEDIRELGPANHYSKEDNVWRIDENGIRWCFYQTNLFGDPHLSIKNLNEPPDKPTIQGPTKVVIGDSHDYIICSQDPEGEDLLYKIDIDDGSGGEWLGPYPSGEEIVKNISFKEKGYVTIKVTARDEKGALSETAEQRIQVPRNKVYFNYNFKQFIRLISLLKYLLFPL